MFLVLLTLAYTNLKADNQNIWPKGWLPATKLPPNSKENWLQCMIVLWEEGETCPDGRKADKDIICGKWRRYLTESLCNFIWSKLIFITIYKDSTEIFYVLVSQSPIRGQT